MNNSFGVEEPSIRIDAGIGCRGALDYTFWPKGNTGRVRTAQPCAILSPTTCREIRADILALEKETEGLLAEIRHNLERAPQGRHGPQVRATTALAREVLVGLVERVTFHNPETGFCVLRIKARGQRDLVTAVGHAATISAGEWITASGEWTNDRTHGLQFRARFLRASVPSSIEGIEKYLGSGMIRGIGPVYARRMVQLFGTDVFDIIEASPGRLREVEGIGPTQTFLEQALDGFAQEDDLAALPRTGAWECAGVDDVTWLAILRIRHRLQARGKLGPRFSMAEEAAAIAFSAFNQTRSTDGDDAFALLDRDSGSLAEAIRRSEVERGLAALPSLAAEINAYATERAEKLADDHSRVRQALGSRAQVRVDAITPVDIRLSSNGCG